MAMIVASLIVLFVPVTGASSMKAWYRSPWEGSRNQIRLTRSSNSTSRRLA